MITDLPTGTHIRMRNARSITGYDYGVVVEYEGGKAWMPGREPDVGVLVHKVVWLKNVMQSRGTFIHKERR